MRSRILRKLALVIGAVIGTIGLTASPALARPNALGLATRDLVVTIAVSPANGGQPFQCRYTWTSEWVTWVSPSSPTNTTYRWWPCSNGTVTVTANFLNNTVWQNNVFYGTYPTRLSVNNLWCGQTTYLNSAFYNINVDNFTYSYDITSVRKKATNACLVNGLFTVATFEFIEGIRVG